MGVNLQDVPPVLRHLHRRPILPVHDLLHVLVLVVRPLETHDFRPVSVMTCYGLKVTQRMVLGEKAELNFVASDIEERRFWKEKLTENGVKEVLNAGAWDVHEGQRHREEGDGDTVCHAR